jgi:hypothetical protein
VPSDRLNRRRFFRSLVGEVISLFEEIRGTPQCRISELFHLPDQTLAKVKPLVQPNIVIAQEQGQVYAYPPGRQEGILLFPAEDENITILEQFNGKLTIAAIAKEFAENNSWSDERAFLFVKDIFLSLVELHICVPSNPVR